ncbi:MAG: HRDC domain-containing protein [Pseudomonadota bacterium]
MCIFDVAARQPRDTPKKPCCSDSSATLFHSPCHPARSSPPPESRRDIHYIDSQDALDALSSKLEQVEHVGFDTEFLRERTYHPNLCLAQLAIDDEHFLIDPLSEIETDQFWPTLLGKELTLHSGRQDLEVLLETTGQLPELVYDTQIAAGIVGLPPQVGYAKLVEMFCDVQLDKAHTRTNWSRRPLAEDVLAYAVDDVRYLAQVREALAERAQTLGRSDWVIEDCEDILDRSKYDVAPSEAWTRLRGIRRLPYPVQQRAMALSEWREKEALRRNLPRQWVLRDEALINLSFDNPKAVADVGKVKGMDNRSAGRHGQSVVRVLGGDLPEPPTPTERPDNETRAIQKAMAKQVRELGVSLQLESEVLAPQRELKQAALGNHNLRALRGWRQPLLEPILAPLMPNA